MARQSKTKSPSAPALSVGGATNQSDETKGSMNNKLKTYLRGNFAALFAVTHEEDRITEDIGRICADIGFQVYTWTPTVGITCPDDSVIEQFGPQGKEKKTSEPAVALACYLAIEEKKTGKNKSEINGIYIKNQSVLVLKDFHLYLKKGDPVLTRLVKDAIASGRATARSLLVMGCQLTLPPELEKEFTVVDFPLPDRPALKEIAVVLAKNKGIELNGNCDDILDAGMGLTMNEFADAVAASLIDRGSIEPDVIADIKAQTMKKGGILEIIKPGTTFKNLGGMGELKSWITRRRHAFSKEAAEFGLQLPKGVILVGVQGGGKSYATRAIADELNCPLLRLDTGKLFAGIVGSSEANVRGVIAQVEAFGKCVLQIDEIDKGFAGMVGGHDGDSGTTRRVIGTFLTWMAEKTSPCFIVATANDLTKLPPELLRKGRWDEMFFIDLPDHGERVEIWKVHLARKRRELEAFDLEQLAKATEGWTGAEIEALVNEGLYSAFDSKDPLTTEMLVELSTNTMPLSKTMAESLDGLRRWADGRCRSASLKDETGPTMVKPGMKGRKFS